MDPTKQSPDRHCTIAIFHHQIFDDLHETHRRMAAPSPSPWRDHSGWSMGRRSRSPSRTRSAPRSVHYQLILLFVLWHSLGRLAVHKLDKRKEKTVKFWWMTWSTRFVQIEHLSAEKCFAIMTPIGPRSFLSRVMEFGWVTSRLRDNLIRFESSWRALTSFELWSNEEWYLWSILIALIHILALCRNLGTIPPKTIHKDRSKDRPK